jgi:hypothetical protein
VGKNKKPMLTVLVEEEKLQRFRDYASTQGLSMGAVVNQLIDRLLGGESSAESIETSIDNTIPIENIVNTSIENNNKSIEVSIAASIDNYHKSIEEKIEESIEGNNKAIEKLITVSIDSRLETLPPPLSLLDVDRLIGSAIESVTTKNNAELAAMNTAWVEAKNEWWLSLEQVKIEHRQQIAHQHTEIDRLNKRVDELVAANIESPTTTAIQPPNGAVKAWGEFCEMIGVPGSTKPNKASGDEMVEVAKSKGLGDWRYNGNKRKFTQNFTVT